VESNTTVSAAIQDPPRHILLALPLLAWPKQQRHHQPACNTATLVKPQALVLYTLKWLRHSARLMSTGAMTAIRIVRLHIPRKASAKLSRKKIKPTKMAALAARAPPQPWVESCQLARAPWPTARCQHPHLCTRRRMRKQARKVSWLDFASSCSVSSAFKTAPHTAKACVRVGA
jgi:hypothetical protein